MTHFMVSSKPKLTVIEYAFNISLRSLISISGPRPKTPLKIMLMMQDFLMMLEDTVGRLSFCTLYFYLTLCKTLSEIY